MPSVSLLDDDRLPEFSRKTAADSGNALYIAEYVYNRPEISEESKLGLHHLKLDLVGGANIVWRSG